MRIVARCVIFLAAFPLVGVAALNLAHLVRVGDIFHWGTLFGAFQIVVAMLAVACTIVPTDAVRYLAIGGVAVIAIERLWTVASRSYTNWTMSDWTLFVIIVVIPPFAILASSLFLPRGRRVTGTADVEGQGHG